MTAKKKPATKTAKGSQPDMAQPKTKAPSGKNWQGKEIVRCFSQSDLDAALTRSAEVEIWLCGMGRFVLRGESVAFATDSADVEAWENAHVEARGNTRVEAWENTHVEAWENTRVEARGNTRVVAWENTHVEAWENTRVEARGNTRVVAWENTHVEAWENTHVEAWENTHVEAWENTHVEARGNTHVVAWENTHVVARGNTHVVADGAAALRVFDWVAGTAGRQVVIQKHSRLTKIAGGIQIDVELPATAADWCAWHGVKVADGIATVYKGVNASFRSDRGADYTPGSTPVAADWDGGRDECGGGLHFCPTPSMTRAFTAPEKFVACSVRLSDMRAPKADDQYSNKIKAAGCCAPCVEVDVFGKSVKASAA